MNASEIGTKSSDMAKDNNPGSSEVIRPSREGGTRTRPVPLSQVRLGGRGFWADRVARVAARTIPKIDQMNEASGRYDNFRIVSGQIRGEFKGIYFNDSDVYKWIECAAWSLVHHRDAALEARVDEIVDLIAAAQMDDGYLDTFYQAQNIEQRWTRFRHHEMYCAGHLIQAAIAYNRSRGKRRLLDVAIRFADHICAEFGVDRNTGVDTHPEIEMALVELYRETGDRRYLEQATYFIDARGIRPIDIIEGPAFDQEYHQNRTRFRQLQRMEGHVVRMLYLTCGAADAAAETTDTELREVLDRLWSNMVACHLYATGGLGSRRETEGFGRDYVLPNREAYAETCAAVASIMWNWRMLLLENDRKYADLIELTLYNGMLSGVSLDGEKFFYVNPLADDGAHRRQDWFECACCPSNVARTLASLPGYFYSTTDDAIFVHLYDANEATLTLPDGMTVGLTMHTEYPWSGTVAIDVESDGDFGVCLRIPAWAADGWQATVNGEAVTDRSLHQGYLRIERSWSGGDRVTLEFALPVRKIAAHPDVQENAGRLALMCGPVVYCFEAVDNGGVHTERLAVEAGSQFTRERRPDLDNAVVLQGDGRVMLLHESWDGVLYQARDQAHPAPMTESRRMTAIPYYAWANRDDCSMNVWLHEAQDA